MIRPTKQGTYGKLRAQRDLPRNMDVNWREAEFDRVVGIRKAEEERRIRHNLRRRAIKKRDLQQQFRRRRLQNFLKENEVAGCRRAAPPLPSPPSPRQEQQKKKSSKIPQDGMPYKKRDGFTWSDLGRTPKTRLSLVVPPIAVKGEREFIERLLRKVETEHIADRQRAREQQDRVATQRERLRKKIALSKATHGQSMVALSKRPGVDKLPMRNFVKTQDPEGGPGHATLRSPERKGTRGAVLSQRHEQLARPRKAPDVIKSFVVSGSTDLVGLLHANPALKGFLEWHLEDLRKDLLV